MEEIFKCFICQETIDDPVLLTCCAKSLCRLCGEEFIEHTKAESPEAEWVDCPYCRDGSLNLYSEWTRNIDLKEAIECYFSDNSSIPPLNPNSQMQMLPTVSYQLRRRPMPILPKRKNKRKRLIIEIAIVWGFISIGSFFSSFAVAGGGPHHVLFEATLLLTCFYSGVLFSFIFKKPKFSEIIMIAVKVVEVLISTSILCYVYFNVFQLHYAVNYIVVYALYFQLKQIWKLVKLIWQLHGNSRFIYDLS